MDWVLKSDEYSNLAQEYKDKSKKLQKQIERVKAELMGFNKRNLKKIYELEDLIE